MNMDNMRLREIQQLKIGYRSKIDEADTMSDMFHYMDKIDELTIEETEILKRCKVEV